MTKVAFVGLGNMGGPMAANLVRHGYGVAGFDLSPVSSDSATKAGITMAGSLADVAKEADCIITMLPKGDHVISVWTELIGMIAPRTVLIDCSTVDVDSARQAHALAEARRCLALDAPVSGGTGGATAGTLTFMAGGSDLAFQRAQEFLGSMGKKIIHCGGPGAGQAAKICNNMILGISMIGVCEAFVLGEKLGLSHQALFDVASTSSGQCWSLNTYCPVPGPVPASPANNDYKPGFTSSLMLKDLLLAQEAARFVGASTPLGVTAAELFARFDRSGQGGIDFSGIIDMLRGTVASPGQIT